MRYSYDDSVFQIFPNGSKIQSRSKALEIHRLDRKGDFIIAGQPDEKQARERNIRVERFSAQVSSELLTTFAQLIQEGNLKVAIEATYPLSNAGQAHEHSKRGHGRGRVVIHVAD